MINWAESHTGHKKESGEGLLYMGLDFGSDPSPSNQACHHPCQAFTSRVEGAIKSRERRARGAMWWQGGDECFLEHSCFPRRKAVELGKGVREGNFTFSSVLR